MTSNEILKADVLDILFENRNKLYGAYALRRAYDKRLGMALGLAMGSILLLFLLFPNSASTLGKNLPEPDGVKLTNIEEKPMVPPPQPPKAPKPPMERQQQYTSQIQLVRDDVKPDVPDINALTESRISVVTAAGDPASSIAHPAVSATVSTPASPTASEPPSNIETLERQPEFPGGIDALRAFLSRNLVTPSEMESGERKTVYVHFTVGEDGTVTRFEIVQSAGAIYDQEVLRVLKKMPRWRPAIQNWHPVTASFTQPVTFQAAEE
jgi:protein TonB